MSPQRATVSHRPKPDAASDLDQPATSARHVPRDPACLFPAGRTPLLRRDRGPRQIRATTSRMLVIIDDAAIAIDIVLRIRFALGLILDFGPRQSDRDKHAGLIREANDPSSK